MEIQLTPEREAQLDEVARKQGRDPSTIADEALAAYLEHLQWISDAVEEGRAAANRGELIEHEDVLRMIEKRYTPK